MKRMFGGLLALLTACASAPPVAPSPVDLTALIDARVEADWRAAGVEPAPEADDAEFLRRVTLDLIGRVPTLAETELFLADATAGKRVALVDRLLASDEAAAQLADRWTVVLYGRDPRARPALRAALHEALRVAFAENRPFDELVRSLLVSTGPVDEVPASAFLTRHLGESPETATGRIATSFLGLRIQCAQCHDHPYDARWKQTDFYGMTAWLARTKIRRDGSGAALGLGPVDVRKGEANLPHPDGTPGAVQAPTFLGKALRLPDGVTRRAAFADLVTNHELFSKALVNRTWRDLFGRGLVEPVDELGGPGDPLHPPLLGAVADGFVRGGHDVKGLLRAIVLSRPYARASTGGSGPELEAQFARAAVRPMSPEQLFRSLATITGAEEALTTQIGEEKAQKRLEAALRQYLFAFADDEMGESGELEGSVPQALILMNGELPTLGTRTGKPGTLATALKATPVPAQRIEQLFRATFSRSPAAPELADALAFVEAGAGADRAWADLFHVLLTSVEATVVH
jgi:hypothetical protein